MKNSQRILVVLLIPLSVLVSLYYANFRVIFSLEIVFTVLLFLLKPQIDAVNFSICVITYMIAHAVGFEFFDAVLDKGNNAANLLFLMVGAPFSFLLILWKFYLDRKHLVAEIMSVSLPVLICLLLSVFFMIA
ncbi:hypothetical protein [Flavicella sediminum]|uniref:hypothetical protein n=1 Tax=Flavicella sediminum TaxID=2585141 RepID=UPI0011237269|nr:hypothetical protein [Flavicella sediminum]